MIYDLIYRQGDPRWGDHKMGKSKYTMAEVGCLTTAAAMAFGFRPDVLNNYLNSNNGYYNGAYLRSFNYGAYITDDVSSRRIWVGGWGYNNEYQYDPAPKDKIELSKAHVANGQPILIQVDFVPEDNKIDMHWGMANKLTPDGKDFIFHDPINGFVMPLTKTRYGKTLANAMIKAVHYTVWE